MSIIKKIFGLSVYTKMPRHSGLLMSLTILGILIGGYLLVSHMRHIDNPSDKIVPTIEQLARGIAQSVSPDRNGNIPVLEDTLASLRRFGLGVSIGSILGIMIGVHMGLFPFLEALMLRPLLFIGKIPPLAILPILFVFSGLGESTKIILIVMGITPSITLDVYFKVKAIPQEQLVKALTLGASSFAVMKEIVVPQIMPSALTSIRINLLPAWLFLIASETIAADAGLGYRIFLVRRYLAMDIIIPYVLWIAFLSFLIDAMLAWWISHKYRWYEKS